VSEIDDTMMDDEDEEMEEVDEAEPTIDESETEPPVEQEKDLSAGSANPRSREPSAKSDTVKIERPEEPNGEKSDSRAASVVVKTED